MLGFRRSIKSIIFFGAILSGLIYLIIAQLQRHDEKAISVAKDVDTYINKYCRTHGQLPSKSNLTLQFPALTTNDGWYFFTDDKTWLKFQYPVRWKNSEAIGLPKYSEFTATVYAYSVEYSCNVADGL